jgi:hypothetical protein
MRTRVVTVLGIAASLALAACGSGASGRGNLGTVAGASTPPPATSHPGGGPSTAAPGSGGSGGSGGSAGSGGGGATAGGTSPSDPALRVTVATDPIVPAVVVTDKCPYSFTMRATVSVNKGPVDLKYLIRAAVAAPGVARPLHFGGTGPQSKVLTVTGSAADFDKDITAQLQILDRNDAMILSNARTFHLTCGVRTVVVYPTVQPTQCPYVTDFHATLTAPVPEHATYEWHLGDGTVVSGEVDVPGNYTPTSVTVNSVKVTAMGLTGSYTVALKITSPGGGTTASTVQCPAVNQ